jgi:hypothetical protein
MSEIEETHLMDRPNDEIQASVTFEEFVAGVDNGKVKYVVQPRLRCRTDYPLLKGLPAAVSHGLTVMSYGLPSILIPLCSYLKHDWVLLLGFIPMLCAMVVAQVTLRCSRPYRELFQFTLCLVILLVVVWYTTGFFTIPTFMVLCFLYAYFWCSLTSLLFYALVTKCLIADAEHYYAAVAVKRITVVRI